MSVKTVHVIQLIESLAEKAGESLDYYGFGRMSELIPDDLISQKYLDDLYRNMNRKLKEGHEFTRPSQYYLDHIARFLGHKNFNAFSRNCENVTSDILVSSLGNWWSLVRASNGEYLMKSPVQIFRDDRQQICMRLIGKDRDFEGQLEMGMNCIFGLLHSGWEKRISMVFKIASSREIKVIQGVFCGISPYGEPMAGREVLIREDQLAFSEMKWTRLELEDSGLDESIRRYFGEEKANCLRTERLLTFELEGFRAWR